MPVAVVAVLAAVLAALWVTRTDPADSAAASAAPSTSTAPPAAESARPNPAGSVAGGDTEAVVDPPAEPDAGNVAVVVTYAGWEPSEDAAEVSGFVAGVVEAGGTCRLELRSRGGRTAGVETEAEPDASTTVCGTLSVPRQELSEGTWTAVLSYESATSSAASDPVDIEVPAP